MTDSQRLAHKEVISRKKLDMLRVAASHVIETGKNDFPLNVLRGDIYLYNNFQKLRYHGLVHHVTVNGQKKRGHWVITRNGWAFLRGELALPSYVLVQNNKIVAWADERVRLKDVWYGFSELDTTFQYFDEHGEPIGWRPGSVLSKQATLL